MKSFAKLLWFVSCALLAFTPASAKTIWVGSNTGTGTGTESDPYKDPATAFANVADGDTVYIKEGTYKPGSTLTLAKSNVTIAGAPGTAREKVILHGNWERQIMKLTGGFTVSGLTFESGRYTAWLTGAGLHFTESSSPSIVSNCVFHNNNLTGGNGGALYTKAPLTIVDSTFDSNSSAWEGGAIFQEGSSQLTIERCRFTNNKCSNSNAGYGNAINVDGSASSSLVLRNSYFYNNGAYNSTGNGHHAVCVKNGSASVSGCTFKHNGGAGVLVSVKSGSVDNCLFADNTKGSAVVETLGNAVSGATTDASSKCFTSANAQFDEDGVTPLSTWTDVVDAGSNQDWMENATDLLGKTRICNSVVDIGAVEYGSESPEPPEPPEPPVPPTTDTIWVDGSYSGGDSDGSEEKPYTTLAAAAAKVNAGDTIYIRKGNYVPAAQVDLAKGITISGAPGTTRDEVVLGDVTGYNVLTLRGAFTVANLTIANVGVSNNEPGYGGAIRFNSSTEASVVSNCVFRNCKTAWQAGAINVQSPVTVVDCVFENNETAYEGGAIQAHKANASLTVDRCRFTGNKTKNADYGHVIHAKGTGEGETDPCQSCTVRNSYFYGNGDTPSTAYKSNYALFIGSGVAGAVENCTFKQNVLYTSSGSVVKMVNGTVRNCLFVANERGWNRISDQTGGSVAGGATVEANFCEPDIAQAKFESDGVTPQKGWTEVINKGVKKDWMTGAKDLLGRARVSGGKVDIGAVERQFFSGLKLIFR